MAITKKDIADLAKGKSSPESKILAEAETKLDSDPKVQEMVLNHLKDGKGILESFQSIMDAMRDLALSGSEREQELFEEKQSEVLKKMAEKVTEAVSKKASVLHSLLQPRNGANLKIGSKDYTQTERQEMTEALNRLVIGQALQPLASENNMVYDTGLMAYVLKPAARAKLTAQIGKIVGSSSFVDFNHSPADKNAELRNYLNVPAAIADWPSFVASAHVIDAIQDATGTLSGFTKIPSADYDTERESMGTLSDLETRLEDELKKLEAAKLPKGSEIAGKILGKPTPKTVGSLKDGSVFDTIIEIHDTLEDLGDTKVVKERNLSRVLKLSPPGRTGIIAYFDKIIKELTDKEVVREEVKKAIERAEKTTAKGSNEDKAVERAVRDIFAKTGKTTEKEQLAKLQELYPDESAFASKSSLDDWVRSKIDQKKEGKEESKKIMEDFKKVFEEKASKVPTYPGDNRKKAEEKLLKELDEVLEDWDDGKKKERDDFLKEFYKEKNYPATTGKVTVKKILEEARNKREKEFEKNTEKELKRTIDGVRDATNTMQVEEALRQLENEIAGNAGFGEESIERLRTFAYALSPKIPTTPAGAPAKNEIDQFKVPLPAGSTYEADIEKEKDEKKLKDMIFARLKDVCYDPTAAPGTIRANTTLDKKEKTDALLQPIRDGVFMEVRARFTALPKPTTAAQVSDATLDTIKAVLSATVTPPGGVGVNPTIEQIAQALFLKKDNQNYAGVVRDIQAKFEALLTPIRFREHPTQQISEPEKDAVIDRMSFSERIIDEMLERMPAIAPAGTMFPLAPGGAPLPPTTPRQQYLRNLYSIIYSPSSNTDAYLLFVELASKHGQVPDNDVLYYILMKEQIHRHGFTQPLLDIATHGFEQNPLIKQHLSNLTVQGEFEQCTAGFARMVDHLHQTREQLISVEKRTPEQEKELAFLNDRLLHRGKLNPMIENLAKNYHKANELTGDEKLLYEILARKYNSLGPTLSAPAGTMGAVSLDKALAQSFIAINALRTAPVNRLSSVGFDSDTGRDLHQAELDKQHHARDEYAKAQNTLQKHNFFHIRKLWGGGRINRDSLDDARESFVKESRRYILETLRHEFPGEELNNPANKTKVQNRILQLHNQLLREFIQRRMQLYSEGTGVMDRVRARYERFRNWHRRHKWLRIGIGVGMVAASGAAFLTCQPWLASGIFSACGIWGAVGRTMGITGAWEGLRNRFGQTKRLRTNQIPKDPDELQKILASHVTLTTSERTLPGILPTPGANANLTGLGAMMGQYGAGPGAIPPIGESEAEFNKRERPATHQLFDSRGSRWFDRLRPRQNARDAYRPSTAHNLWNQYNADNRNTIDTALSQEGASIEKVLDALFSKQKAFLEQIENRETEIRKNNNIKNLVAYSVGFIPVLRCNGYLSLPGSPPCWWPSTWGWPPKMPWSGTGTPPPPGAPVAPTGTVPPPTGPTPPVSPSGTPLTPPPAAPIPTPTVVPPISGMPPMPPGVTGILPPGSATGSGAPVWGTDVFRVPDKIFQGTKLLDPDPGLMQSIANKAGIYPGDTRYINLLHDKTLLGTFKDKVADFMGYSNGTRISSIRDAGGVFQKGINYLHPNDPFQITPTMINAMKTYLPGYTDQQIIDVLKKP